MQNCSLRAPQQAHLSALGSDRQPNTSNDDREPLPISPHQLYLDMPPASAAAAAPSANTKRQRACLLCSLLLSSSDFRKLGCPNCEEILRMKGSSDKVTSCTSAQYDGVIAVVREGSWVSKWQRTGAWAPFSGAPRSAAPYPDPFVLSMRARPFP